MDKEITIEYKPNIEVLTKVSKYLLARLFMLKYLPIFVLAFFALITLPYINIQNTDYQSEFFSLSNLMSAILIILFWVFIYFRTLNKMKKIILNNKRNFEIQKIIFNNEAYIQEGETFKITSFWNETHEIVETKDWFLIYPRKNSAFPIVKSNLSNNQQTELKALFNYLPIKKSLK
jgi:hypothetical protein